MAHARHEAVPSFQQQVLDIIKHIPSGSVSTYREIARALHRPRAARAVGNALNKNPHLVVVPCHRIVTTDGRLGGYREGIERKKSLLKREGVDILPNGKIKDFTNKIFSLTPYAP